MKKALLAVCIIFLSFAGYTQSTKTVEVNLGYESELYQEIKEKYGNLWITYTEAGVEYDNYGKKFVITEIHFYYKKDGQMVFLGLIDKTGVYDKNKALLKKHPISTSEKNLGIGSSTLEYPFSIITAIKGDEGYIYDADTYCVVKIDFINNTLITNDLTY